MHHEPDNSATVLSCPASPSAWKHVGYAMPDWVASGDPVEEAAVFLEREAVTTGVWRCQPGCLRIDSYPFDEFCVVLEGRCTLTPEGSHAQAFGPGEAFLVRKGFRGTWDMPQGLRKFYVEMRA